MTKRIIIAALVIVLAAVFFFLAGRSESDFSAKYSGHDLSGAGTGRENTYTLYRERHAAFPRGQRDIPVDIFAWASAEGVSIIENFQGEARALRTEEAGYVQYSIDVQNAGLYNIYIEYFPVPSRGIAIERSLHINGEAPFLGAERLSLPRVWGDGGNSRFDNQGNEIRASQVELPRWESVSFRDSLGYIADPYAFYFHQGENTLRLTGVNEPVVIRALSLKAPAETRPWRDFLSGLDTGFYANAPRGFLLKIQGEDAARRSDPSLYPVYDRSSGATEPASVAKVRLNMIGGDRWRIAGQWIEWEFEVPENGLYRIAVKGRQNYSRGFVSNRALYVNGEIPCAELAAVPFAFSNKWKHVTPTDTRGEGITVPLRKGVNTIRLQATHGELGGMLDTMEESVFRLNAVYRKILVLTGAEPDIYRDYLIDEVYPEVITAMALEAKILYKLADDLTRYSGERGAQAASILTLARQLELFVSRPDKIPAMLSAFKGNISSLGNGMLALSSSPLDIDYIIVSSEDSALPPIRENFLTAASHEIRSFLASFFVDYSSMGDVYGGDAVVVWLLQGRDQSSILKSMIDDTFTPQTGIGVNVKLVSGDALMPAVVAGTGPDVVLTVGQGDVINYALRKAVLDISRFPGYADLVKELNPATIVPLTFNGGVWGLPETQNYHVMFYRKDILEELALEPPDTWDDFINILPVFQKNNMNVGIPSVAGASDFSNFLAHLFQRGGRLYTEDGSRSLLDSAVAIEAFDVYTKFFTHYKTPVAFDFVNRFRTGEIPLGFADYTLFNTLEVFAPELRGLWGFYRMPGLPGKDGVINRSVSTGTQASMIISTAKDPERSWQFLRWWISAETQLRFGRELESVMGAAARYPTANNEAFRRLAWGSEQMAVLDEQRSWTVGVPEVPGGYFVNRHIVNAVRRVIYEGQDTRETLLDYTIIINGELAKKRQEFGLE